MNNPFGIKDLVEFRDRAIKSFNVLPDRFRFAGMDRDLTEDERVWFANLDAAVLTLQALGEGIVNLNELKKALNETTIVTHQFGSVFDE